MFPLYIMQYTAVDRFSDAISLILLFQCIKQVKNTKATSNCVTSGAGPAYPSGPLDFIPEFYSVGWCRLIFGLMCSVL